MKLKAQNSSSKSKKSKKSADECSGPKAEKGKSPGKKRKGRSADVGNNWKASTVPQLKEACRDRGLLVGGKKAKLLERLDEYELSSSNLARPFSSDARLNRKRRRICIQMNTIVPHVVSGYLTRGACAWKPDCDFPFSLPQLVTTDKYG